MENRILGRTGLSVMPIGFGGMELMRKDVKEPEKLLNLALDNGINYVDTSPEYGASEEMIGQSISNRRSEFILATKCGDTLMKDSPYCFDRYTCMKNLEDSLRLLKTDYIDVWQIHAVMPEYIKGGEADDVIECMLDAKKSGKVRFIGATIRNGRPTEERYPARFSYDAIDVFKTWKCFDVIQVVYGGMTRICENRISSVAQNGIGIVARGIVKKYAAWYDEAFEKSNISELFEEGESKNDFLIRYALTHTDISCVVIGTKNPEHLVSNIKVLDKGPLSKEIYEEAKRRFDLVGMTSGDK